CQSEVEKSDDEKPTVPVTVAKTEATSEKEVESIESRIQHVPVDAEQLASVLGINAISFKFPPGGVYQCWLEIDETGQSTMPSKFPFEGYHTIDTTDPDRLSRSLLLYWKKDKPGPDSSGDLQLRGNGLHGFQIPPGGFTFGWKAFTGGGQTYPDGVSIAAGQTKTLYIRVFNESVGKGPEGRKIKLTLKARMMEGATDEEVDKTE
ncbi:MAG: hypothetical protein ABGZ17_01270, partial [Planctomycetaceae bacterium]